MSLLFYRRPDYLGRNKPQLTEAQCASYLEHAEASGSQIPSNLSFEEIVKNNTLPPCSLNDFMDYLMYVEYNAECLQFFLWYCDYVERWSKLPRDERDLSPMCMNTTKVSSPRHKHTRTNSYTEKTERFNRILTILEKSPNRVTSTLSSSSSSTLGRKPRRNDSSGTNSTNFSWPKPPPSMDSSSVRSSHGSESRWEPSAKPAAQPFRDEIDRVVHHYISADGPRQLNLTHHDSTACLTAAAETTHPSALLPAFAAAEAVLRGQCHPNFVRWSISNTNRPRAFFVRGLALLLILLGFCLDVVLILSRTSPFVRLTAAPLWCLGAMFFLASRHGICIILHWNYKRNLRPWEQFADEDMRDQSDEGKATGDHDGGDDDDDDDDDKDGGESTRVTKQQKKKKKKKRDGAERDGGASSSSPSRGHRRTDTDTSTNSRSDPLRKQSLQSFGSANTFDAEPWVNMYEEKPIWKRVFEVSVTTQNRHLRAMQDRIVFHAFLQGLLLASALAVGSVFIPSPRLF